MTDFKYMRGFGNGFMTEAIPGSLPPSGQNNPQQCPHGLYSEQLSGTAFTAPRARNQKVWYFKIRPSVRHHKFVQVEHKGITAHENFRIDPNQMRWNPPEIPTGKPVDWLEGLQLQCGSGDPTLKAGIHIYMYTCNSSMHNKAFQNSDGDFLIVPQEGALTITTENGRLHVEPCEIVVIPRGIKFSVAVSGPSRGYVSEVFNGHFIIPDLGPIGANGLANPNDFMFPEAWFEDVEFPNGGYSYYDKYAGQLFCAPMDYSPFDVVAWHGNYAPFKYDLRKFNTMNTVSYDHADPSIFTVITCQSAEPGVAVCDFVIFPPRWMVAEHTFRPPYYHRNTMSEYMGMIYGQYDAKAGGKEGFVAGGSSVHLPMTAHGPDTTVFEKASNDELKPEYFDAGLAFMFESTYIFKVTEEFVNAPFLQPNYMDCWQGLRSHFHEAPHDEEPKGKGKRARK